ncbi:PREDICTED: uncharacterized protein LOC109347775, partial [Lupinus angustifolius]|uniref:uncharacterized protein LOC109347775 n=1 Tax=Lupinus angustifolius TaxID=3871 RepID=UPI00092F17B2
NANTCLFSLPLLPPTSSLSSLSQSLLTVHVNRSPPSSALSPAAPPLLHPTRLTLLLKTILGTSKNLLHLYPKFKIECRSSSRFFSGCLCSFGIRPGMGGTNQTRVRDLEDKIIIEDTVINCCCNFIM